MLSDKFDSLMNLTKTSNASFAKTFNFDASFISKIRSGKRKLPDDPGFLLDVSVFFAKEIRRKKIEIAASSVTGCCDSWPDDVEKAGFLIREWFLTDLGDSSAFPDSAAGTGSISQSLSNRGPEYSQSGSVSIPSEEKALTYYGSKGQRASILHAFEILCDDPKPYNLMVYSDEPLSWFSEDKDFFNIWKEYCIRLIRAGSTFTMIDYLHRDLNEMKEGFRMWIPLVLTGKVRAYHCDGLKNIFFDRTLCIAEEKLAVAYNSIHAGDSRAVSTLYLEKDAVDALSYEFRRYLDLCHPLFDTYLSSDSRELRKRLTDFENAEDDLICIGAAPAYFLSDGEVSGHSAPIIRLLKKGLSVSTILSLPKKEDLMSGKVPVPMGSLSEKESPFFRPEEYISILENILETAEKYPNCKISVSFTGKFPKNLFLMLKSSGIVFLDAGDPEEKVFFASEPSVISSMQGLLAGYTSISNIKGVHRTLIRKYITDIRRLMEK